VNPKEDGFKTCYQCVAIQSCFPFKKPNKEVARELAAKCTKPFKGVTTDVINIVGQPKGMSRKKAFRLTQNGKGQWVGRDRVKLG